MTTALLVLSFIGIVGLGCSMYRRQASRSALLKRLEVYTMWA